MRKYLLDTHTLVWAMLDKGKLSEPVLKILQDSNSQLFVSAVSFWEIAVKHGKGKLELENFLIGDIPGYCRRLRIEQIPLMPEEAINYSELPFFDNHKDPFDRMLIYQCIRDNYTLISKDRMFEQYMDAGLKLAWRNLAVAKNAANKEQPLYMEREQKKN
jgi:PIN domain nuclease of toxin-antitoxin system